MVRQAHTYFTAAIWAAVLNAAAIAAFVLFMVLSSVHGWPLRALVNLVDPVGSAPASQTSYARPLSGHLHNGALFGVRAFGYSGSRGAGPGRDPAGDTKLSGGNGIATPGQGGSPGPSGPSGGGSGPAGPGGEGGSAPASPPLSPSAPSLPAPVGSAVGGVGNTISSAPSLVGSAISGTVSSTDGQLGGGLSGSGISGVTQGATGALLGDSSPGALLGNSSPVGRTAVAAGGAVQRLGAG